MKFPTEVKYPKLGLVCRTMAAKTKEVIISTVDLRAARFPEDLIKMTWGNLEKSTWGELYDRFRFCDSQNPLKDGYIITTEKESEICSDGKRLLYSVIFWRVVPLPQNEEAK